MIFTFWEGKMPAYIELCLATWKHPFVVLNYKNLNKYTDLDIETVRRFTLPQIADAVRVHVLRDQGGYWLDADTIMITGKLPEGPMVGDPVKRTNSIGLLRAAAPGLQMFKEWAKYQDAVINSLETPRLWSVMGNSFTDIYAKSHPELEIHPIELFYPEVYIINGEESRFAKYNRFYFESSYHLKDLRETDLLMLHNSWTPGWYKELGKLEILAHGCTMSNILRETL